MSSVEDDMPPELDDMEEVLAERSRAKAVPASVPLEVGDGAAGESLVRALEEEAVKREEGPGPKYERDPEELAKRIKLSSIDDEENVLQKQMLDAAMQAAMDKDRDAKEKAANKTFLQGTTIKRGFLNSAPKTAAAPAAAKPAAAASGAQAKPAAAASSSSSSGGSSAASVATIKPSGGSSLVIPEVQDAMSHSHTLADSVLGKKEEWMTPDLMAKIMASPGLAAGISNPRYMAALQEMMANPKGAQEKYKDDKGLVAWLTAFAGVLGSHFTKIGEAQEAEAKAKKAKEGGGSGGGDGGIGLTPTATTKNTTPAAPKAPPAPAGIMGIGKDGPSTREIVEGARAGKIAKEDDDVREILSNPMLVETLRDPRMHMVLEDCRRDGRRLAYWRTQPAVWTRLKLLESAGLIRLEM